MFFTFQINEINDMKQGTKQYQIKLQFIKNLQNYLVQIKSISFDRILGK